jgi:hypothetical protein
MSGTRDLRQLRRFGLLVGGIFSAIGFWPLLWRQEGPRLWALAPGLVLVLGALIVPRILAPVHRAWMALGDALGWVNTRILLGVVFYGLVTPIGLVMRLRGRDPMSRRFDHSVESYRVRREPRQATHMMRQF